MKCNHHVSCDRSESAPSEDRPYTTHTGANPCLSSKNESFIENGKEREREEEREREREREKEKERLKGANFVCMNLILRMLRGERGERERENKRKKD
jgi:hypothetical protein